MVTTGPAATATPSSDAAAAATGVSADEAAGPGAATDVGDTATDSDAGSGVPGVGGSTGDTATGEVGSSEAGELLLLCPKFDTSKDSH